MDSTEAASAADGSAGAAEAGLREAMAPVGARPIERRRWFSDMPDKGLFILFAIGGIAATFVAKSRGTPAVPTTLVAVGVLVAYAVISSQMEWFRLHPDRLGDNCYYMGFLFTLTSLSAALIAVEEQSSDARGALLESLIGSFGVALFSTIAGIALRVFFMQMRREIEDVEEKIRNDLQGAAQQLKDQLGAAVGDLDTFRLRTSQVMDEQLTSRLAEFTAASAKLAAHIATSGAVHAAASERLTQSTEKAAAELAAASDSMAANMQRAGAFHRQATESLLGTSKKVAAEVSRLVERIDRIEVPSDLLTRQVEDVRQRLGSFADALQAAAVGDAHRQAAMQQAAASFESLLQRLTDATAFSNLEQSADRLIPALDTVTAAMRSVGERAASHAKVFSTLTAQAERDAAAIAQARAAAQADLAQSTEALHQLQDTLATVAENMVKRLGGG